MSLEYMLLIGAVFVIMVPIFYYALTESTGQIRRNQAEETVVTLAKTADSVYALGPGSRDYVSITIPTGIRGYSINESTISLTMDIRGAGIDFSAFPHAPVTGSIPITSGTYKVPVEMLDSGIVRIGTGEDTVPPVVVFTYPSGNINFNDITLKANTNEPSLCKYDPADQDYSAMANPFVGTLMSHESYVGILPEGNHVYYARCIDPSGNVMQSSAIINFTINTTITGPPVNETYEPDPPVITLVAPEDDYTDNDGIVLFQYNVSDNSSVPFCELMMNNTLSDIMTGISKTDTNSLTKGGFNYGHYNWSINCTDSHGNEGSSDQRRIFINYTQDSDLPLVYLMAPADNTVRNYWLIKFTYNTTDATSGISYCTMHINGTLDIGGNLSWSVVDDDVMENTPEMITLPLFQANYTWRVSCTDSSLNSNKGYSELRHLRINITAGGDAYINSCAGWCGWQGLSNGRCENNIAKCGSGCGLPYSQSSNCYTGDAVSSQYCTGGAESDTCCCVI
ncbi:MAG TPA: hypothetical protein VJC00_02595 [Candidatus Nanoarchaeia archaeon]|nr:hypothetical protein [Candidatus Nanoarchaeia archaeon]